MQRTRNKICTKITSFDSIFHSLTFEIFSSIHFFIVSESFSICELQKFSQCGSLELCFNSAWRKDYKWQNKVHTDTSEKKYKTIYRKKETIRWKKKYFLSFTILEINKGNSYITNWEVLEIFYKKVKVLFSSAMYVINTMHLLLLLYLQKQICYNKGHVPKTNTFS